jgi:transcriptional regulator with XRE-family HTH domain
MPLIVLQEAIEQVYGNLDRFDFGEMLRVSREAIGLKQFKASEFLGIAPARLKNLETGYFRSMPSEAEMQAISRLYDIQYGIVHEKAKSHVDEHTKAKKVRMHDE